MMVPKILPNWIDGQEVVSQSNKTFSKVNPTNGEEICLVSRSNIEDVHKAVSSAGKSHFAWAETTPVKRGAILHDVALKLRENRDKVAKIVALETGKSFSEALGETDGAISLGLFFAGEGQRLYGRTSTSGVDNKYATTVRQPIGIAGLIIAANTPIANVAWKVFPALICGNAAILKAAEDAPITAWIFAKIANKAGLPPGVLNVIQGFGAEAGAPLVADNNVDIISFTGSTVVGQEIAEVAGKRMARVSLELGGKNPLVVCDDAELENAAKWVLLSAFSNAGQRCSSGSRIIIFDSIYEKFKEMLIEKTSALKIGSDNGDDLGPVINEKQLNNMLHSIGKAKEDGAIIISGGYRLTDAAHKDGFFLAPTLIENALPDAEISTKELFGPITCLYRVNGYSEALEMANDSPYGLTACIHTQNINRAIDFAHKVKSGVAVVNAGTYGSEPHMPFGGLKKSGNGTREPGTEALDIYSNLKDLYICIDPKLTNQS
jgi:aldehyde dehydrogenase (NAD+)